MVAAHMARICARALFITCLCMQVGCGLQGGCGMKVRHIKRRTKRPEFTITCVDGMTCILAKSAKVVTRFFGPTKADNERAAEFFGIDAARLAGMGGK